MKKYFSILSLTLTCIVIFSFSKPITVDYRDNYCGSYVCKSVFTHMNQELTGLINDTSTATIVVQKNTEDSIIDIITPIRTLNVKVRSGIYYAFQIKGRFFGDSLYLKDKPSHGPTTWTYFGKK